MMLAFANPIFLSDIFLSQIGHVLLGLISLLYISTIIGKKRAASILEIKRQKTDSKKQELLNQFLLCQLSNMESLVRYQSNTIRAANQRILTRKQQDFQKDVESLVFEDYTDFYKDDTVVDLQKIHSGVLEVQKTITYTRKYFERYFLTQEDTYGGLRIKKINLNQLIEQSLEQIIADFQRKYQIKTMVSTEYDPTLEDKSADYLTVRLVLEILLNNSFLTFCNNNKAEQPMIKIQTKSKSPTLAEILLTNNGLKTPLLKRDSTFGRREIKHLGRQKVQELNLATDFLQLNGGNLTLDPDREEGNGFVAYLKTKDLP